MTLCYIYSYHQNKVYLLFSIYYFSYTTAISFYFIKKDTLYLQLHLKL